MRLVLGLSILGLCLLATYRSISGAVIITDTLPLPTTAAPAVSQLQPAIEVPLTIDGAKTPHLISDDLAYTHFVLAVAVRSNPTTEEVERSERELSQIGLRANDLALLRSATAGVRDALDRIQAERTREGGGGEPGRSSEALKAEERTVLADALGRVQRALNGNAQDVLNTYIHEHVKRNITVHEM